MMRIDVINCVKFIQGLSKNILFWKSVKGL